MAEKITKTYQDKSTDYWQGEFQGDTIKFKVTQLGHQITEAEADQLLNGEMITIKAHSARSNKDYDAHGHLQKCEYNGHPYYGFVADFMDKFEN